jgi:hypothetical protein
MKKTILDENEVKRILSLHKIIKEQTTPPTPAAPPTSVVSPVKEEDPLLSKLRNAKLNGCLSNGTIFFNKTKNMYYFRGVKQSTKQEIDFYPDMTYKFVDGSTSGKWKCDNIERNVAKAAEETTNKQKLDTQKQAFIDNAVNLGYKEEKDLTPDEIASGSYKEYKVPGSERFFPPNGITMWWSPSDIAKEGGKISTKFEDISKSQTINKSICKNAIDTYYEGFKTKKDIPQVTFDPMKKVVQSCVNTYEGEWGGFLGVDLKNTKKYVEILRGGEGGPSRRGEDSKWRLN